MKRSTLSIFLTLIFLLSVFMFCATAFAASGSQDGVTAVLTTDKAEYASGEPISVALVVKNGNARVDNIRTELILPSGLQLSVGAAVSDGVDLLPNAEANYSYGLGVDSSHVPSTTTTATTTATTTITTTTTVTSPTVPVTTPSNPNGPSNTGDISLYIFGGLAIFALVGLIVVFGGFKGLLKSKWFVLVLCIALFASVMVPAAIAAQLDKPMTVSTTIKVDGVNYTISATITYDLNEDVLYTEDVAFKENGQFLWDVDVEMGYYLPAEVEYNGQLTSKDGSYRPEVTAPYIDMLFGTANKAGEFTANIFNSSAQQKVLIGLTDDPASKAALELIDEDEWIIAVIDGKLVVTGWYDNATASAARALYTLGSASADNISLPLPMVGKMNYVDVELPAVPSGTFSGGMDSDFGAIVLRWNEVEADDFDAYCAILEAAGYTLRESNTMDGFKQTATLEFATYVKGDDAILVQYLPVSLIDQDYETLTEAEKKAYDRSFSADGDAIRLILSSADLLTTTAAENTGWNDRDITPKMHNVNLYDKYSENNIGLCQIYTLADGSFIVVDGGDAIDAEQVYRTLKYMNERPDGEIVVAAWILTHAHEDHTGAIRALSNSEYADEITVEQVVLNHSALSYRWRTQYDPYGMSAGWSEEFANIRTVIGKFAQGENFKLVMPHMGQIMHIRNAELEFLSVGDEDLFPVILNNDNGQSLVFRVTFPETTEQTILVLGDSALDQTYNVYFPLMCGELYADILQVAHHGLGGQTSAFYPMFTGIDVSIWPTTMSTINEKDLFNSSINKGVTQGNGGTSKLDIVCEEYVHTLVLPFDADNDQVIKTKIGTYKSRLQKGEMTLASLGVGRFGGDLNTYLDATVNYLLGENANADVLVLNSVLYKQSDGTNVVEALADAMDYPFYYYAPAWNQIDGADMTVSNDGTYGNLILSRYPIVSSENLVYHQGTTADSSNEGRGAGHVVLDVEGKLVDVYFTEVTNENSWAELAQVFEPENELWFIMGIGKNTVSGIQSALDDTTVHAAVSGHTRENIYSNDKVTFTTSSKQAVSGTIGCVNMDEMITATAQFALYENTVQPKPETEGTHIMGWWVNGWRSENDALTIAEEINTQNPDIAVILHAGNHGYSALTSIQLAELVDYPFFYIESVYQYATGETIDNLIFSKTELEFEQAYTDGDNKFSHLVTTVDGRELDLFVGYEASSAGIQDFVKNIVDASGNDFVIVAEKIAGMSSTYAGKNIVKKAFGEVTVAASTQNQSLISSSIVPKPESMSWAGYDDEIHMVLSNTPPTDHEGPDTEEGFRVIGWWVNGWRSEEDAITLAEEIKAQNPDIAVILSAGNHGYEGLTSAQLAELVNYPYHYIVEAYRYNTTQTRDNIIFSKTELSFDETYSEGGAVLSHLTTTVSGRELDLFVGYDATPDGVESYIKGIVEASGNDFIIVADNLTGVGETYADKTVVKETCYDVAVIASTVNQTLVNSEVVSKPSSMSWDGYDDEIHMVLKVTPPTAPVKEKIHIMAWWVNGWRSDADACIVANEIKEQDADIAVILSGGNHGYPNAVTSAQMITEVGYPYSYVVQVYQYPTGETIDNLIFSKFALTFVESEEFDGDLVSYLTTVINDKEVDLFVGKDIAGAEDYIAATVAASGHELMIFTGDNASVGTTYAGKAVDSHKADETVLIVSTGTMSVSEKNTVAKPGNLTDFAGYENEAHMVLTVAPVTTPEAPAGQDIHVMNWWVNGWRSAADAEIVVNEIKTQNPDIAVILSGGNHGTTLPTSAELIEMTEYPYSYVVTLTQYNPTQSMDNLILSKTALTFVESMEFAGGMTSYLTTVINGREVDLFVSKDITGAEEYIADAVAESGNEFLVFTGCNPTIGETYAGKAVDSHKADETVIIASTGNLTVKDKSTVAKPGNLTDFAGYENEAHMTVEVKP